jgi:4-hydroxybenzoate polyprenyltransferase
MNTTTLTTNRIWAYLQLMRPANIITAWADILAGFAVSGYVLLPLSHSPLLPLPWLLISTTGLYGGGIVLNDVFDAELDAKERPERPIPSGRASLGGATLLGLLLLGVGIVAACQVSLVSGVVAFGIAVAAVIYDAVGKHHPVFGPLNMGMCRGGNLLLGVSIIPTAMTDYFYLALIPITYIAAITVISRGEVHGSKNGTGIIALSLLAIVLTSLLGLGLLKNYNILTALPFVVLLSVRVLLPFIKAVRESSPECIRAAVKAGVLSLIVLDSTIAAGFAGLSYGLVVLCLLPVSIMLARLFAVT